MTDLTKADAVAALRSAAAWNRTEGEIAKFDSEAVDDKYAEVAERYLRNAAILRALADAIEQAERAYSDTQNKDVLFSNGQPLHDYWRPVWIIPAPRLP